MHKDEKIIIDSKSGTTGAGKSLTEDTHFPKCNESFHPYKIASHRHTPEIEQELSKMAHQAVHVMFTPHLLPVNRGIISTIYVPLKDDVDFDDVKDIVKAITPVPGGVGPMTITMLMKNTIDAFYKRNGG